jgi:hypothetical protein
MPRLRAHYAFTAGETDPRYERRADWEYWVYSAQSLLNLRVVTGGGVKRRPGLARVTGLTTTARLQPFLSTGGVEKLVILEHQSFRVLNIDETQEASATGMAWSDIHLPALQMASENDSVTIASTAFWPKVMTRSSAGSWSVADLAFAVSGDGAKAQPYYRFPSSKGITLTPSGVSGAITLTASASLFAAGHVGTRFRLFDREVEVTGFTSSTVVNANTVQTIYPTLDITVASSTGFNPGDAVSTSADEIDGEVATVVSATVVRVNLTGGYTVPTTTSNKLVGPTATSTISSIATAGSPAATVQWDEQMISSVRGFPAGCGFHRGRRLLFGFPLAPHVLIASAQDETDDFDLGTAQDADAIQVGIGDAIGRRIRHAVSAEQLIILTDSGPYYVGEGPGTPFTPTTVDFLDIGPEPAADAPPVKASEGVIYKDRNVARILVLAPTGNVRRSWDTADLSDFAPHLLAGITRLALIDGSDWGPERYIAAVNGAGDLALCHYRRGDEMLGWTPWRTNGTFVDIAMFNNKVYVVVNRSGVYTLQRFDEDRLLDHSLLATGTSSITNVLWTSATWELVWRKTVSGEARRASLGSYAANGFGIISGLEAESRDYEVGYPIAVTLALHPPIDPQRPMTRPIRISRLVADVVSAGHFTVNDRAVSPYRAADDQEEPPPLRTGQRMVNLLGCRRNATVTLAQSVAAPLEIRSLVLESS